MDKKYRLAADKAYDDVAQKNGGKIPSLEDVAAAIVLPLGDAAERERQFRLKLAREADNRKLALGRSSQLDLFAGGPAALDGYMALGDGRRVQIRVAVAVDWVANMDLQKDNVMDVMNTYQTTMRQHAMIAPYLARGLTTEQAVQAYQRDNHPKAS